MIGVKASMDHQRLTASTVTDTHLDELYHRLELHERCIGAIRMNIETMLMTGSEITGHQALNRVTSLIEYYEEVGCNWQ